jgi:hypothetical protein
MPEAHSRVHASQRIDSSYNLEMILIYLTNLIW